jgi:hypothetical protein
MLNFLTINGERICSLDKSVKHVSTVVRHGPTVCSSGREVTQAAGKVGRKHMQQDFLDRGDNISGMGMK